MTIPDRVDYRGIRFTSDHVAILDGDEEAVTIPVGSIHAVTLRRGFIAERPLMEALVGLACCAIAALAVRRIVFWLMNGGTLWDVQILLILLLPLGITLVRDAAQRGFYLLVELDRGVRKVPFVGGLDEHFPAFARQAELLSRKAIDQHEFPLAGGLTSA